MRSVSHYPVSLESNIKYYGLSHYERNGYFHLPLRGSKGEWKRCF